LSPAEWGRWYSINDAAARLGIKRATLQKQIERGAHLTRQGSAAHPRYREMWLPDEPGAAPTRETAPPVPSTAEQPAPLPYRHTGESTPDVAYHSEVDERRRVVVCYGPVFAGGYLTISFDRDAELARSYTQRGGNRTAQEIANGWGWPLPIVKGVIKARGLYKSSFEAPDWEVSERGEDAILEDIAANRRLKIMVRADRARVEELKRVEDRQHRLAEWIGEVTRSAGRIEAPRPPRWSLRDARPSALVVDAMTDAHVEQLGADGSGHIEARAAVLDATDGLIERTVRAYTPGAAVLLVGSDWLDADTYKGTTTQGTQQRSSLPPERAAAFAFRLLVDRIQRWRAVCPVRLVVVPGNHDRLLTTWLAVALDATFADAPDVTIYDAPPGGRVYMRHGACLLGFCHGDGAKPEKLPGLMADEAPDQHGVRHRHWITGHRHVYEVRSQPGGDVTTAPSIARGSAWEAMHFGGEGKRAAVALYYDAVDGHVGSAVVRG